MSVSMLSLPYVRADNIYLSSALWERGVHSVNRMVLNIKLVPIEVSRNMLYMSSPRPYLVVVLNPDLFVNRIDALTSKGVLMRTEVD